MNEYIKTAQELAKLPGTDKWPWALIQHIDTEKGNLPIGAEKPEDCRWHDPVAKSKKDNWFCGTFGKSRINHPDWFAWGSSCGYRVTGPWLRIDDFSPWSAAKWLERAFDGLDIDLDERAKILGYCSGWFNSELDYNKAILAIGQRAFGLGDYFDTGLDIDRKHWLEAWNRGQDVK